LQKLENRSVSSSHDLTIVGEILEVIGDRQVEVLEQTPDLMRSWSDGLAESWSAADGAMEARIGFLEQTHAIDVILKTGGADEGHAALRKADVFQDETIELMLESGVFKARLEASDLHAEFVGANVLDAYQQLTKRFRPERDEYITASLALHASLQEFNGESDKLLAQFTNLEEFAGQ
jgi:hypothetical protein